MRLFQVIYGARLRNDEDYDAMEEPAYVRCLNYYADANGLSK